jgi:spore germination cell wall hydrolase CwlJ-like protein
MISAALMCLALNIYHEARSEPAIGQAAVAHVVLNRVMSNKWPNDVCEVVHQGYSKGRYKCQFSWYCDGKSDDPTDMVAWAKSVLLANEVLIGNVPDVTNGATHYHARYVKPYWSAQLDKTVTYGSHIFYE